MQILLVGLSHKTAPVEVREKFCLSKEGVAEFLGRLRGVSGIQEEIVLSTCNRLEVLVVAEGKGTEIPGVKGLLAETARMESGDLDSFLYQYEGEAAVGHFFRVAASLDSLVLGEPQILGQVKEAYGQAVESKGTGLLLNKLLHRAFFVAKRVRTETKIAAQAVSVSFAAVELAKKILGDLEDKRVLLIGAGEMSELAARHFLSQGVREIFVANRTFSRAADLAREFKGQAFPFEEIPRRLREMDIILSSTGSHHYVVRREELAGVLKARKNRPMFFIDIAVPRDIDPKINELDNAYVYDIDDLEGVVESNREDRKKEAARAREIIAEGVASFQQWLRSLEAVPTILALRGQAEEICRREVSRTLAMMKAPPEEHRRLLEALAHSIVNKILHHPISTLKRQEERGHGKTYTETLRKMFRLDPEEKAGPGRE